MSKKDERTWPFSDPENVAVFTLKSIIWESCPILLVTHDADDGCWQFLAGSPELREEDAGVVCLREIVEGDPSVRDLADLPLGWRAWRQSIHHPWARRPKEE
jgi:hypothetical protein